MSCCIDRSWLPFGTLLASTVMFVGDVFFNDFWMVFDDSPNIQIKSKGFKQILGGGADRSARKARAAIGAEKTSQNTRGGAERAAFGAIFGEHRYAHPWPSEISWPVGNLQIRQVCSAST